MLLSDAIQQYLAHRTVRGYSKSTVKGEGICLRQFLAVVGNIQTNYIEARHVDLLWHRHSDWGASTANLRQTQLAGFFDWCRRAGYMDKTRDPLDGLKARRVPQSSFTIIPPSEFPRVLQEAPGPRDRAFVALGLYLFTRVSEGQHIRWRDLDFDNHGAQVFRKKTGEYDVLPMCEELEEELNRWRFEYGRLVGETPRPGWFVCPPFAAPVMAGIARRKFKMMAPAALLPTHELVSGSRVVKQTLKVTGYDAKGEGGHTLRRSGAVALYHQLASVGHDRAIRMCQTMLGHKNIATTEIYLRLDLDKKARNDLLAGRRMFPEATGGQVVQLRGVKDGEENARSI